MTKLTGRPLRMETVFRLAAWGDWSAWTGRCLANGMPFEYGPVRELELGGRAHSALLANTTGQLMAVCSVR